MYKDKTFLAIIPARGGSKRLPRKNILDLAGKPMIAWSIDAGLQSQYIDRVIVSSDDVDILAVAQEYGSDVLLRPKELAGDASTTFDAVQHVIMHLQKYDYIILLQVTSPLRTSEDIDRAIESLFQKSADAVVSVCEMEHSPLWANKLPDDKSMHNFLPKELNKKRSQDLERYYRLNGAIYISETEALLEQKSFFLQENIFAYEMHQKNSVDVDTELDFDIATFLLLHSAQN